MRGDSTSFEIEVITCNLENSDQKKEIKLNVINIMRRQTDSIRTCNRKAEQENSDQKKHAIEKQEPCD